MDEKAISISWLGHAMFLIETSDGTKIVTDPYSEKTGYTVPKVKADIVTVSHHHYDHDNVAAVNGSPQVVENTGKVTIGNIVIEGIPSYHDEVKGSKRGDNIIFKLYLNHVVVAHMGDFGQLLSLEQEEALRDVDVLLIPVGGTYTIDARQAAEIVRRVKPKIVIPMHYKTAACGIDIETVAPFLEVMPAVVEKGCTVEVSASKLPDETETWVLSYIQ